MIQLRLPGSLNRVYTHKSYFDTRKYESYLHDIHQAQGLSSFLSLAIAIPATRYLMNVGVIKRILPARYPTLVAGLFTYLFVGVVYENLFGRRYRLGKLDEAMESTTIPYWKDSKKVVNLDRIFFDLDDYKKNKINILYHGINIDHFSNSLPDGHLGPDPKLPEAPHAHH